MDPPPSQLLFPSASDRWFPKGGGLDCNTYPHPLPKGRELNYFCGVRCLSPPPFGRGWGGYYSYLIDFAG